MTFHCPDSGRVKTGMYGTPDGESCGAFFVRSPDRRESAPLKIIASNGRDEDGDHGWEHVSVSLPHRCPTWAEMCHVKAIFWDDSDPVMQLHPAKSDHVNNHSYCLHLWRPTKSAIPLPPAWMVGDKSLGVLV